MQIFRLCRKDSTVSPYLAQLVRLAAHKALDYTRLKRKWHRSATVCQRCFHENYLKLMIRTLCDKIPYDTIMYAKNSQLKMILSVFKLSIVNVTNQQDNN